VPGHDTSSKNNSAGIYDLVILGAGPAGLTAAIYGGRAGLKVLVVEQMLAGGEIANTAWLDNYPGFPDGISGVEFSRLLEKQALRFGAEIVSASVEKVEARGETKRVFTSSKEYTGRTLIIATGTVPRELGVPGEDKLRGRGISFCATCDGPFFRDKKVAVVGGGDSAVEEALYLTRFASHVYIIHRRERFRVAPILQEKAVEHPRVEVYWNSIVKEFAGEQKVEKLLLENVKDANTIELDVDGVFLYVGRIPKSEFIQGIEKDEGGFIVTNEEMKTALPGVYAAGDIRRKYLRQVVTAAADGAIAASMALKHLGGD